ncbi:MAG: hypothetical protein K9H15_13830 [Bacteroidales bacterium]|nr:hypothetical protein [Bacteroidales bacterium]
MPLHCHLWGDRNLKMQMLNNSLIMLKVFEDSPHLTRKLMQCNECRQLYLYEFCEIVDRIDGNDSTYYKWIPVESIGEAEQLCKSEFPDLLHCPSIRIDFPTESEKSEGPYFISF